MKKTPINFRDLLERVLPLEDLAAGDRLTVQRALGSGLQSQIEEAALFALRQLEQSGAMRRLPPASNGGGPVVRYASRDRLDVVTLQLPEPETRGAWRVYPRASLPPQARTGVDQVRRLLHVDDLARFTEPLATGARSGLAEPLQQAGRELLGATDVRLIDHSLESALPATALQPDLATRVIEHPSEVWYCPDALTAPEIAEEATRRGFRSVVLAGISGSDGRGLGHLEIYSNAPSAFEPDDLALVALLADFSGGVLERAARIERLMFVDPLTNAYNRSYFDLQMQNEMARAHREGASIALCIVDIDNFKSFNTKYGYRAGNEVLVQVSGALRRAVRPFDTVSRWGGEEFAVLLTAPVTAPDVAAVTERLRTLVEKQVVTLDGLDGRSHRVSVTVSIGVSLYPDHAGTDEDLWSAANQALLEAKRPPKNQVVFFRPPPGVQRLPAR